MATRFPMMDVRNSGAPNMLPSLDNARPGMEAVDMMDPGRGPAFARQDDANGNGIPDVLERTTTTVVREKFGARPAPSAPQGPEMQATLPDGRVLMGDGGRVASFSPQEQQQAGRLPGGFNAYGRRFTLMEGDPLDRGAAVQPATPRDLAGEGLARAASLAGATVQTDLARNPIAQAGGAEAYKLGLGIGPRQYVNRFRMMKTEADQKAEGARRFDLGLQSGERVARIEGNAQVQANRFKMMGDVSAAQIEAQQKAADAAAQREADARKPLVAGNRAIDPVTGTEIAPQEKQKPGLVETQLKGVYIFTDQNGDTKPMDLRENIQNGKFDVTRYMVLQSKDPAAAEDYIYGRGQFAAGGSPASDAAAPAPSAAAANRGTGAAPDGTRVRMQDGKILVKRWVAE